MMLSGKGMFTWRLANCEGGDMRIVVNQLRKMQATHILVKIADGTRYYHENDPYLDDLFMLCHEANIKVLGWQYVYGDRPVEEASAAINALQSLPYDGFVVNAEKEYADIRKEAAAEVYCQFIRNAYDGLFALSSYRAPWLHPNFPFAQFLSCVDLNMPQVYWMQSEGFAPWELDRMEHQFAHSRYPQVPLFPTGAAFQEHGWQAKPEDVRTFIQESECRGYQGVNFWRYEQAFHRLPELGKAIAETPYKTKENTMDILFRARCKVSSLRIRRGPGTSHAVVGWISQGHIVDVFEVSNGWYRIGANRWVSGDDSYMERITDEMPEPDTEPLQSLYYPLDERWPVSQVFGVNPHWYPNTKGHNGVDFAVPVGNPIYAAADGKVIVARSETSGYGRHMACQAGRWMTLILVCQPVHIYISSVGLTNRLHRCQVVIFTMRLTLCRCWCRMMTPIPCFGQSVSRQACELGYCQPQTQTAPL